MLFVVDLPQFKRLLSIVRDDRTKKSQTLGGPFLRLEVRDNQLKLDGHTASAQVPATVYESGVLFLKVTAFRRLLGSISAEKFLTIQVTADSILMDRIRMPLGPNEMVLFDDTEQAPQQLHADVDPKTESKWRQLSLWNDTSDGEGLRQ